MLVFSFPKSLLHYSRRRVYRTCPGPGEMRRNPDPTLSQRQLPVLMDGRAVLTGRGEREFVPLACSDIRCKPLQNYAEDPYRTRTR